MKKLVIALMAFALVISLAGCGGGGGGSHSDNNDHGAFMKTNFPEAYAQYGAMTSAISKSKTSDTDGSKRADSFIAYVDENAFKPETNARAAFKQKVTMSITKKQFRERLLKLFSEVSYGNFTVSPLNTTDSNKEEKFIVEATQFIFSDKVKYKEDEVKSITLTLHNVKWQLIGETWKITGGLEDLMKSISTLKDEGKVSYEL